MTEQRRYQPPGQDKVLHLRMGELTHHEIDQEGQLLEDQGRLRCHDGGHGPKGHPAPPAHLLVELQVRIQLAPLVVNNGQVRSIDGHLRLPCPARENGCKTMHRMYVWPTGTGNCQLKNIRTISPNQTQETWLVDHHHKLLFNQTGMSSMTGCQLALIATHLRNLYLVDLSLPELNVTKCHIRLLVTLCQN